jgi:hypothetical protein
MLSWDGVITSFSGFRPGGMAVASAAKREQSSKPISAFRGETMNRHHHRRHRHHRRLRRNALELQAKDIVAEPVVAAAPVAETKHIPHGLHKFWKKWVNAEHGD